MNLTVCICILMLCVCEYQEAAALAAAEVAFMLHSGAGGGVQRRGGLHFAVAPELISNPQHQPEASPQ